MSDMAEKNWTKESDLALDIILLESSIQLMESVMASTMMQNSSVKMQIK